MKVVLALVFLMLISGNSVSASSVVWSDSFDSDLLQWEEVQNAQHANPDYPCRGPDATRYEWTADDGSAYLGIQNSTPCSVAIVPKSDSLADLPAFAVSFTMKLQQIKQDRNWLLRWHDKENSLAFHIFGQSIYPEKVVAGKWYAWAEPISFPFKGGETYFVRIEYDQSLRRTRLFIDHTWVYDFFEPPGDPQLLQGRPGLAGSVGSGVSASFTWYDAFTVTELGSTSQLDIVGLKQTDVRWKDAVYDQADLWSPESDTIERWGCALVGAVMTLRFHGLQQLPSGQEMTPLSLNTWLQQQPDGYFGEGHMNWRALTRLSWELHEELGTTKLEFRRWQPSQEEKIPWLKQQIQLGLPVILEQPSHFILASGYGPGEHDIQIEDPYYSKTKLSEYDHEYLSARLFTPSHTDLSALTVVAPLEVKVSFWDQTGVEVRPNQRWIEQPLQDVVTGQTVSQPFQIFEFLQPVDANLRIQVNSSEPRLHTLTVLAYQKDGQVTRKDWMLDGNSPETSLEIQYKKNELTQFSETPTPHLEKAQLMSWLSSEDLGSPLLLEEILVWQEHLNTAPNLQSAEAWLRKYSLLLTETLKAKWITPLAAQQIRRIFQDIVTYRYP